jgi:hypothetical protein
MPNPQGMMPPAHSAPWNPFLGPAGLVPMPAHGEPVIPVAGGNPGAILPDPAEAGPAPQVDRLGRHPDDVKAMIQERARRQYEQRFGQSFGNNQSLAAAGQKEELDALIARLGQARQAQMEARRATRRGM